MSIFPHKKSILSLDEYGNGDRDAKADWEARYN